MITSAKYIFSVTELKIEIHKFTRQLGSVKALLDICLFTNCTKWADLYNQPWVVTVLFWNGSQRAAGSRKGSRKCKLEYEASVSSSVAVGKSHTQYLKNTVSFNNLSNIMALPFVLKA